MDADAVRQAREVRPRPFLSLAPAEPLTPEQAGRLEDAQHRLIDAVRRRTLLGEGPTGPMQAGPGHTHEPVPRVLGFGALPRDQSWAADLTRHLPLEDDDSWLMLFDLPEATGYEPWFADGGHLEVWIRRTDLHAQALDRAWMLLRR
jgi:hypothetical protein